MQQIYSAHAAGNQVNEWHVIIYINNTRSSQWIFSICCCLKRRSYPVCVPAP